LDDLILLLDSFFSGKPLDELVVLTGNAKGFLQGKNFVIPFLDNALHANSNLLVNINFEHDHLLILNKFNGLFLDVFHVVGGYTLYSSLVIEFLRCQFFLGN